MLFALLLSLLVQVAAAPAQEPALQMVTYQMVFLKKGPVPEPADAQKLHAAHLEFLAKLNRDRVNLLYGPFLDDKDPRGIVLLDVKDADAAWKALADEPFVKAGHLAIEVRPWMGPKGWFSAPSEPPTQETLVFGILMRGPSTSQTREEAQAIQKGHLAYMDDLHKQGKLVMAGPLLDNTEMRGIVVYRVATVEDAKQLAAGDPAVKAGRLVVDARPWTTFKGILK